MVVYFFKCALKVAFKQRRGITPGKGDCRSAFCCWVPLQGWVPGPALGFLPPSWLGLSSLKWAVPWEQRSAWFAADENACLLLGALAVMFSEFKSMSGTEAGEQQAHYPLHGDVGMYQALPGTPMTRTDLPLLSVPFPSAARQRRCLSTKSKLRPSPFFPFSPARVMGKWLGPFGHRTRAHFQPKTMSTSRTIFARTAHGKATSCFTKNHGTLEQAPEITNTEEGS